jgi:hopanoid biosynthesis associated RND transporter like protein HpnN
MRRERFLDLLADAISRWPLAFVLAGVLLAGVAGLYARQHLEFKTSRNDLIGRDSEYWRLYSEYTREFQAEEDYIIVVESPQPAQNRAAVDALVKELLARSNNPNPADAKDAQQFIPEDVFARVNYDPLKQWFLYYLSTKDLLQIRDSLKDFNQLVTILERKPTLATFVDSMSQMLEQMANAPATDRAQMVAFVPTISGILHQFAGYNPTQQKWQLLSPWAGAFFSEEMVSEAEQQMKWQGYHVFKNGQMYIVLIHPRVPENLSSPERHAATIPKLRRIITQVRDNHPDVRIGLTGEPVLDNDEMVVSERDATRSSILTVVLVGAVVVAGFRDWLRMFLSITCLILVIIVTMGYATLTVGHLNIVTITFTVMILGLGEDLGVQFISRFEEELSRGADRFGAVRGALQHTAPSIITAGVTNAAAFFAMTLSGFKGVVELGIIAGGGMLLATIGMVVVLPAMLLTIRRRTEPSRQMAKAQITAVERVLLRRPRVTLIIGAVVTVAALALAGRVRFDYNVLNLQSKHLESVDTELRLLHADAESTIYAAVIANNLEEARALHAALTNLPSVAAVHSVAELVPEHQEQKAPLIRDIRSRVDGVHFNVPPANSADVDALARSLASLRLRAGKLAREAGEQGDAPTQKVLTALAESAKLARDRLQSTNDTQTAEQLTRYEMSFFSDLQAQLELLATQSDRPMQIEDIPPDIRRMLVGHTGKLLLRVFPAENIWERGPLEQFVKQVQSVAPNATGTPRGLYEFIDILQHGYIKAALWAFLVIAVMVYFDLRSLLGATLTLMPIVVGTIWMVGAMALFGIRFNPANILTLPLMVGIGVAYGIYVVRRYREDGEATFYGKSTGRAVMLSALTAVIAFSSLLTGAHRGISSLGLVMSLGVVACLLASLALLPALLEVARRRGWKV